jgi:DNA polymerase-3 subunit gamma/tau
MAHLGLTGAVKMLASNCAYLHRQGNTLYLSMDPRAESMLTKSRKQALGEALSRHFGESLSLDIALGKAEAELAAETPAQKESRMADERLVAARKSLESDPNVLALKEMFGAEIRPESIEARDPAQND